MSLGTGQTSVLGVTGRDIALADSANYYVMTTPTAGTGIIGGLNVNTNVATTPLMVLYNGGLLNVYLLYLRLSITVAGVGAVTRNFTHAMDQGNKIGTATVGTQLVSSNVNILSNTKSSLAGTFGSITGAGIATPNQRILWNDWFRMTLVDIIGDVYEWQYGAPSGVGVGSTPATVCNFVRSCPPIVLPPNSSYTLTLWSGTISTGITFEVNLGYAEK